MPGQPYNQTSGKKPLMERNRWPGFTLSGEGGIRTRGKDLGPYTGLANRTTHNRHTMTTQVNSRHHKDIRQITYKTTKAT